MAISQQAFLLFLTVIDLTLKKNLKKESKRQSVPVLKSYYSKQLNTVIIKSRTQNMLFSQYDGLASVVKGNEHACYLH